MNAFPLPLLSATARFAVAGAVAALFALATATAENASHDAVLSAQDSFARADTYVTLPRVEIVVSREASRTRS